MDVHVREDGDVRRDQRALGERGVVRRRERRPDHHDVESDKQSERHEDRSQKHPFHAFAVSANEAPRLKAVMNLVLALSRQPPGAESTGWPFAAALA